MQTIVTTEGRTDEVVDFITNLDIEKPWTSLRKTSDRSPAPVDEAKAGFVNDGSLACFVDGISAQRKKDVLSSCLLAQLTANKMASRWQAFEDWYRHYVNVLRMVGWDIDECHFMQVVAEERTIQLQPVIVKALSAIASDEELLIVQETMDALKSLKSNDRRLVLFDTQSQALGRGNFQVSTVFSEGKNLMMNFGAFSFAAMSTKTRMLWHNYNARHTEVWHAQQCATLDEQFYAEIRATINEKLDDSLLIYTGSLDLMPEST